MADTGASLRFELGDVQKLLDGLILAGGDQSDLMDRLGAHIELETQRRFETERDPDGNPWPKSLRALAEGSQTLTETARLRQSITRRATASSAEVGTNVVYSAIHQFGGTVQRQARTVTLYRHYNARTDTFDPKFRRKSKSNFATDHQVKAHTVKMTARPFLGAAPTTMKVLGEIARDWLAEAGGLA